jgi:hypothetical protein
MKEKLMEMEKVLELGGVRVKEGKCKEKGL